VGLERIPDFVADAVRILPEASRPADLEALLCGYLGHLVETNEQINLVSRRNTMDHVEVFTRECLFLVRILIEEWQAAKTSRAPRVLDVGSGGGFPGMVLKIAMPEVEIQMVEATRKKARFLAEVSAGLDLRSTSVVWARAENLAEVLKQQPKSIEASKFDWVTGKGLGSLQESTLLAGPFLRAGGVHWTFKGSKCREELAAASGMFRQRGFVLHRSEPIPGERESYVIGIRRLAGVRRGSGRGR
jgi:16S rRNA (guanine527-N7)-methyltransferase